MQSVLRSNILRVLILFIAPFAIAFAEEDLGEVAFRQALLDLGTDLRLMCVAAHPDDEDGATLAMYRKLYGYKTFAVLATRGEGGMNEIGSELYEELGVIRTHEMMAASQVTGAELHFLNYPEFGYSKTLEETMRIWGHDEALGRMVRMIRLCRPDVIISNHGTLVDHGNHQAVGQLLREAFDAAADTNAYPEHFDEGLEPWQPARLYLRAWRETGKAITVDISTMDPWRGKTYAEIAAEALRLHWSQGMDFFINYYLTGRPVVQYVLEREHAGGVSGAGDIDAPGGVLFHGLKDRVDKERRGISKTEKTREELKDRLIAKANEHPKWNRAAAIAAGLRLNATLSDDEVVPGQDDVTITAKVTDFGEEDASQVLYTLSVEPWFNANTTELGAQFSPISEFDSRRVSEGVMPLMVHDDQTPTIPHELYLFKEHFLEPQLTVTAQVMCDGPPIKLHAPLYVDVAQSLTVEFVEDGFVIVENGKTSSLPVQLAVTSHREDPTNDSIYLSIHWGEKTENPNIVRAQSQGMVSDVSIAGDGQRRIYTLDPFIDGQLPPAGSYTLEASLHESGSAAIAPLQVLDIDVPKKRDGRKIHVGVVQTYDDTFVATLERLGVSYATIGENDWNEATLDQFTTIIVDMRAYLKRPDLIAHNDALLSYVDRGGTAIVMYQKTFEWKPEYAPYPITVSRNRVTVEEAPIELLVPDHPLFTTPNKIQDAAWDDWTQERGTYFPSEWDEAYTPLIACSDSGEDIPPGSTLVAEYGEGAYLYTTLVWYRQLREVHPGCLRIFANMLAL